MKPGDDQFVVTVEGECFKCVFKRKHAPANRDVILYFFEVEDAVSSRGKVLLSVPISGGATESTPNAESREGIICLNAIRRAFDAGVVRFGQALARPGEYFEIPQALVNAQVRTPVPDSKVREFIVHLGYWLGYKNSPNPGGVVYDFGSELELEYLGVDKQAVVRYVWRLAEEGFLSKGPFPTCGRPTAGLVARYESQLSHGRVSEKPRIGFKTKP